MPRTPLFALALSTGLLSTGLLCSAWAEEVQYRAMLNGGAEVPPKTTNGTGEADCILDTATRQLAYTITFQGLSGPATMAHFHGPAGPGANAGVVVNLGSNPSSPISGHALLTPAQVEALQAGQWYVNVHTAANPNGEIRGQLTAAE